MRKKTRKGVAKRFKVTASGKLLRRKQGFTHGFKSKSTKRKRSACQDHSVYQAFENKLVKAIPYA